MKTAQVALPLRLLGVLALTPVVACTRAGASPPSGPALRVENIVTRIGPGGVGAVYFDVINEGDADRLVSATTAEPIVAELHEIVHDGPIARMVAREDGFVVPARQRLSLRPGAKHLMLSGLAEGTAPIPVELRFERAGLVRIEAPRTSALEVK